MVYLDYVFWENYKLIELGTKVSLDEFLQNKEIKENVRKGIKGLYEEVMAQVEKITGKKDEDAIWDLAKAKVISPNIIQELLDVISLVKNLDKIDDVILYTMLVRIMEDLEQLYFSVNRLSKS